MKTIYLLRHAKSSWKDTGLPDIDRPLNKRGKQAAEAMADYMNRGKMRPDLILCSAAKRTRATLERLIRKLGPDIPVVVDEAFYHAEAGELLRRLQGLEPGVRSVMIVGHNPTIEDLAHRLAGGGDKNALQRMAVKFPTAALAVLSADIMDWRDLRPGDARLDSFTCARDLA